MVRLITGTGGGYGKTLDRPAERVALDARNGYISLEQAQDINGVILNRTTIEVEGVTPVQKSGKRSR